MLHIVNKSPYENSALESCLRLAAKGTPILLIEDAVYAALDNAAMTDKIKAAQQDHQIFALGPDLKARGIAGRVMEGVNVVDYGGFVDLVVDKGPANSWL